MVLVAQPVVEVPDEMAEKVHLPLIVVAN